LPLRAVGTVGGTNLGSHCENIGMISPVETDIEHTDLDSDDDDNEPTTGVFVSIVTADGMRYSAHVAYVGTPDCPQLAEMILRAAKGAGSTYSPDLGRCIRIRIKGSR
jgi:hypothetical protein